MDITKNKNKKRMGLMRDYRYILFHAALRRRNLPTRAPPLGNVPAEKKRIIKTKIKFNNYVYFLLMK